MVLLEVCLQGRFLEVGQVKGRCLCSFVRYCHISLLKGCTELRVPIFPKSHQQFVLIFSFCQSDRQEVVSQSCFHLHFFMSELEHFLRYLEAIYISRFCELSVHFFSIPCPSILRVLYTLRIVTSCLWNILPKFSSRLSFVFDFVYGVVFFCYEKF